MAAQHHAAGLVRADRGPEIGLGSVLAMNVAGLDAVPGQIVAHEIDQGQIRLRRRGSWLAYA